MATLQYFDRILPRRSSEAFRRILLPTRALMAAPGPGARLACLSILKMLTSGLLDKVVIITFRKGRTTFSKTVDYRF